MTVRSEPVRTIRISDVVQALEIAAVKLNDAEQSIATLKAWAAAGRVTPAGQLLTPEAVAKGVEVWRATKAEVSAAARRQAPTPLSAKRQQSAARTKQSEKPKEKTVQAISDVPAETPEKPVESANKRPRKLTYAERTQGRKEEEARLHELTEGRFQEVLSEIRGHMEEILRRTGEKALKEFKNAPPGTDSRELYMRLVHQKEPEVQTPEELNAQLLPHQAEGLEWLASLYVNGLHGILADEMGLGKTIQTIALLLFIKETKDNVGPHLVVAPKSCISNWQAEFERFAPTFHVFVLTGDLEARDTELALFQKTVAEGKAAVCITNYEQVYRNKPLSEKKWQLVVVDEGHRLKNPETVLHAAMAQLRCRMRLLLTGTPLQNSLNELWALLHYLLPDLFTNMMDFKAWFSKPFKGSESNEFDMQLNPHQEHEVIAQMHSLLAPFLLQRMKSEVLADRLPPRVEVTARVPLSAWQQAVYKDLEKRTLKLLGEDDTVSSEQVNNALMQLRKVVLHPYLFQESYPRDEGLFRASGKVEALDRLLSKLLRFDHKVLIFSQFTSMLDILEEYLRWKKITNVRLDGQVPHQQRKERIDRFNSDPEVSVFLLSSRAGGLGLNLQAADTVVLFDLDWNPQNDKQAIARVHRVGQKKEVRVVRLVTDSAVERHMEARCAEKLEMEQKIMGAGMFRRQATAEQRCQALRAVLGLDAGTSSAAQVTGALDLTSPEELSSQLARSDQERKAFAEMDASLLRPKRGGGRESGPKAPLLERCGRLMKPSEVPAGFDVGR